jgi:hypothetical protein
MGEPDAPQIRDAISPPTWPDWSATYISDEEVIVKLGAADEIVTVLRAATTFEDRPYAILQPLTKDAAALLANENGRGALHARVGRLLEGAIQAVCECAAANGANVG